MHMWSMQKRVGNRQEFDVDFCRHRTGANVYFQSSCKCVFACVGGVYVCTRESVHVCNRCVYIELLFLLYLSLLPSIPVYVFLVG